MSSGCTNVTATSSTAGDPPVDPSADLGAEEQQRLLALAHAFVGVAEGSCFSPTPKMLECRRALVVALDAVGNAYIRKHQSASPASASGSGSASASPVVNRGDFGKKTVVISDLHLKPNSYCDRHPADTDRQLLLHFLSPSRELWHDVDTLVLLGDIIDSWCSEEKIDLPTQAKEVFSRWVSEQAQFFKFLSGLHNMGIRIVYVRGNHDCEVTETILRDLFPFMDFRTEFQYQSIKFVHGNDMDAFNCMYPNSMKLPIGYYLTRAKASLECEEYSPACCLSPYTIIGLFILLHCKPISDIVWRTTVLLLLLQIWWAGWKGTVDGLSIPQIMEEYKDLPCSMEDFPQRFIAAAINDLSIICLASDGTTICGHTHEATTKEVGSRRYFNTGYWSKDQGTFVTITPTPVGMDVELFRFESQERTTQTHHSHIPTSNGRTQESLDNP